MRAIEVFPIPPVPTSAVDSSLSAWPTISSIRVSRPKKAFGAGGGNSPGGVLLTHKFTVLVVFTVADLTWIYVMVSIVLFEERK